MKKLVAFLTISICFLSFFGLGQQPKLMLPIGHTDFVYSVAFSPDGKKVVTGSFDQTAKIWDAQTGILLADLKGHHNIISSVIFSPDGKKIATTSWDYTARIWDAQSGVLLAELEGHADRVLKAAFSPDSKKIVTASDDKTAKIWNTQSGILLTDLKGHTHEVTEVAFSPDGKKIITGSVDKTAKIWDAQTGALLVDLKAHTGKINSVVFSRDGKIAATASDDGTAKLWNAQTGALLTDLKGHTLEVSLVVFSPDGKKIVTGSGDHSVKLWDIQRGTLLASLDGHTGNILAIAFNPDGKKIMTGSDDERAKIWDTQNGKLLADLNLHDSIMTSMAFSPDGKKIVTGDDKKAKVWDIETGTLVADLKGHTSAVYTLAFSPNGKKVITGDDNAAEIWDTQSGSLLVVLRGHLSTVLSVAFSPDEKRIVTGSYDSTAKIWDAQTGTLLFTLTGHEAGVGEVAFSPDGKKILTAANDKIPKVWDARTGKLLVELKGHTDTVFPATFSPDGKKVLTGAFDKTAKLWNTETGSLLFSLQGHHMQLSSVAFSPDGKKILTASFDSTAKVWDTQTGKLLETLAGHRACVYHAVFSPDGKKISTSSFDGTAKIWETQTGTLLLNLKGHDGYVIQSIFSPDGKKIVTFSDDQTSKIWNAQTGALMTTLKGHTSYIKSGGISPDGKYIITAAADNTVRKWDTQSGELLYTFFAVDSSDYLVVDKYNHYDGTAGGRKLLYFTCATEVIALDQVKEQLWVPNLAERINNGETINAKKLEELNLCGLTPETEMANSPAGEYRFIITPRRGGLGETILYVNGIEVKRYTPGQLAKNGGNYELNVKKQELTNYFIAGKENPVTVKAYTADNTIASRGIKINVDESKQLTIPPNLYAVMVGISDYKGDELDLKYAAKDATDISNAIAIAAKKFLNNKEDGKEHVFMYNLTTNRDRYQLPEKNSIKKLLEEIGKRATASDILLIFFAGHGKMEGEKKQFYFLTADASPASAASAVTDVGISTAELSEWMKPATIKAQKRILIFDACNSGQAIRDFVKIGNPDQNYIAARNDEQGQQTKAIDKLNEQSGFFILSASASNQSAYEMGRYSQGLLTYALLKAIKQQSDILEEGKYLNVSRWFNAAEKTVSDLSKESGARQQPQLIMNTNFDIGIVDEEVIAAILLPPEKPLFAASNFQNADENITRDDLGLNKMINLQLNEVSSRGNDSKINYDIASNSPEAYLLSGRYIVKAEGITVRVNIEQGKEIKYRFEVKGSKSNMKGLAEMVVEQATAWIMKNK